MSRQQIPQRGEFVLEVISHSVKSEGYRDKVVQKVEGRVYADQTGKLKYYKYGQLAKKGQGEQQKMTMKAASPKAQAVQRAAVQQKPLLKCYSPQTVNMIRGCSHNNPLMQAPMSPQQFQALQKAQLHQQYLQQQAQQQALQQAQQQEYQRQQALQQQRFQQEQRAQQQREQYQQQQQQQQQQRSEWYQYHQ